ncbi:MAG: ribonuclease III [Betaproteobacteria bacterium]
MSADFSLQLQYTFRQPALLRQALTHRSFAAVHNERLEFIGDAVLNCVVGLALYERFPALPEGDLSRLRAALVKQETLARVAQNLAIGHVIELGEGEIKSGGARRPSILADALEAVFGAVMLDGGFEAARGVVVRAYGELLAKADPAVLGKDPKTRLQEWLQARRMPVPEYVVMDTTGEAHIQQFNVECRIAALGVVTTGTGNSRRVAEQVAAQAAAETVMMAEQHGD